jgi:hypothetical protein
MDLEPKDTVAVIGGARKGLGRACAQVLAQEPRSTGPPPSSARSSSSRA